MTPVCPKCGETERLEQKEMPGKKFIKIHCRTCGQWWMVEKKDGE